MDLTQLLGWTATFLFSIMVIPQILKTIKSRDTSGVSLLFFIIYLIANVTALVYAIRISQSPLILKYIIAIITTIIYIAIFLYFYSKKSEKSL